MFLQPQGCCQAWEVILIVNSGELYVMKLRLLDVANVVPGSVWAATNRTSKLVRMDALWVY